MVDPGLGVEAPQVITATPGRQAFREGVLFDVPNMTALKVRADVRSKSEGNADALFERYWQVGAFTARASQISSKYEGIAIVVVQWWPSRPRLDLMDRSMRRKYRKERHAVSAAFSRHINARVTVVEAER